MAQRRDINKRSSCLYKNVIEITWTHRNERARKNRKKHIISKKENRLNELLHEDIQPVNKCWVQILLKKTWNLLNLIKSMQLCFHSMVTIFNLKFLPRCFCSKFIYSLCREASFCVSCQIWLPIKQFIPWNRAVK